MKRRKRKRCIVFWGGILTAAVLSGCGVGEQDKTIVLPPLENQVMDSEKFRFDRIQQYIGSGYAENVISLAWGDVGTDMLCLLKKEDGRYVYQVIDTREDTVLSSVFVDDRSLANVSIAPGGEYLSYEVQDGEEMTLIVLCPSQGTRQILHRWREQEESFSYIWSDDGTKLFSWQDGDNYAFSPDTDWCVTCYDMETVKRDSNGGLTIEKKEFRMEGNGHAWRHVLPNADGTKVYVREEYESFSDSKEKEYSENQEIKKKKAARNWLIMPEKQEIKKLQEYADEPVNPVKYTKKGLYFQKEGKLSLVENPEDTPSVKELFRVVDMEVNICGNGDHIFLIEWMDDLQSMQLSGVKLEGTEPTAKQALYKASFESGVCISADDSAIVLQGYEYLENDRCNFKVMELGY